jgi:RND family efflux transporter MFP subunit
MSRFQHFQWKHWLGRVAVVAAAGGVIAAAVVLTERTEAAQAEAVRERKTLPLLVEVAPAQAVEGYTVGRTFIGRVEAARQTSAAFDLGGTINAVHFREGDEVRAGDVLAELDTRRLDAREKELLARIDAAHADLKLAQQTFQRTEEAAELDAISAQEADDAARQVDAAKASLAVAEASLDTLRVDLDKSKLVAPYDAVVAERSADEGTVVSPGTVAMTLLDRQNPEVRIGLAGRSIESVRAGEDRIVTINGESVPALVKSILPSRNLGARTVDARLVLGRPLDGIRVGDLASLPVETFVARSSFRLPTSAIIEGTRGLWSCYVAEPIDDPQGDATHVVRRRELQMIQPGGEEVFVTGTLAADELVVISGVHRLTPDLPVRLR